MRRTGSYYGWRHEGLPSHCCCCHHVDSRGLKKNSLNSLSHAMKIWTFLWDKNGVWTLRSRKKKKAFLPQPIIDCQVTVPVVPSFCECPRRPWSVLRKCDAIHWVLQKFLILKFSSEHLWRVYSFFYCSFNLMRKRFHCCSISTIHVSVNLLLVATERRVRLSGLNISLSQLITCL